MNSKEALSIHPTALVSEEARIAGGVHIWSGAVIREGVSVGGDSVIGVGAYIGPDIRIGRNCRIQNYAQVFEPSMMDDNCFIGPGAILTNDRNPRAVNDDLSRKERSDWTPNGVKLGEGVSLGAGSICIGPIAIGPWAMIGAGSIVTRDVPAFALMVGSPARRIGWVGHAGRTLEHLSERTFRCPVSNRLYVLDEVGNLVPKATS